MISLFLLASLVGTIFAQSAINHNGCGERPAVGNFVTGGVEAQKGAHPWQVSLRYGTTATKNHLCGGSLVTNRWIVTAAHCVSGRLNAANWAIDIGVHNRNSPDSWAITGATLTNVISHPSYNSANFKNDIALMRLTNTVSLTSSNYIRAACVRTLTTSIAGQRGFASGWGTTSSGGASLPAALREVDLLFTTDAACTSYYGSSYDATTMICAGEVGDGKDTCQGDSGGPLIYKQGNEWQLVGVTSWGRGCGDIGVYARITTYANWIATNVNANP